MNLWKRLVLHNIRFSPELSKPLCAIFFSASESRWNVQFMNLGSHFRPKFKVGRGRSRVPQPEAQSLHAIRQPNLSNCGLFILSLYLGRCASGQVQIFQLYVSGEIAKLVLLKGVFVCFSLAVSAEFGLFFFCFLLLVSYFHCVSLFLSFCTVLISTRFLFTSVCLLYGSEDFPLANVWGTGNLFEWNSLKKYKFDFNLIISDQIFHFIDQIFNFIDTLISEKQ